MMKKILYVFIAVCTFLFFSLSCGGEKNGSNPSLAGDTVHFRHASHLTMVEYPSYTKVVIRNPWDTLSVLHTYLLVTSDDSIARSHEPHATCLQVPLSRSAVFTSVHCGLLEELDAWPSIAGVCDVPYISSPVIAQSVSTGGIVDLGRAISPDMERIIELSPDAILLSPFENSGGYGKLELLDIPIVECADYMETSALGRAEWMRFYGRMFGCGEQADSLFATVELSYQAWKRKAQMAHERPTVFTDLPIGSAWYVAGGGSTMGRLYADAGAHYLFGGNNHTGSIPHSFETIYEKAQDADFWLIRYHAPTDITYRSLRAEHERYSRFKAYQEHSLYGCNTSTSTFYEEVPFHPERLLAELVHIFHPSLRRDSVEWRFYSPLR